MLAWAVFLLPNLSGFQYTGAPQKTENIGR